MLAAIGDAKTCPHGHPIVPGHADRGRAARRHRGGAKVTILRFENEAEDLLHLFKGDGLEPGRRARSQTSRTSTYGGRRRRGRHAHRSVAETVSVLADPSPPPRTALPEQLVLGTERYGR